MPGWCPTLPTGVQMGPRGKKALEDLLSRWLERFGEHILEVRLYGSRARGDARPGSDLDLLVVLRDDAPEDLEEQIKAEQAAIWSHDDEYAQLAAFVLQEKHTPVSPEERAMIEEGLRARGIAPDDLLPMLAPLIMREAEFRYHQATRDLLYRNLRDEGIPLWDAGADLWNEEGIPVIGREQDVRFELRQAQEALAAARDDLKAERVGSAAARAYYAAFHSARAALLTENIERVSHGDVIAEFNRLTKANRLLGKEFHGKLNELFELRQQADYGRTYVKAKDAQAAVRMAERFVEAAEGYCRRWLDRLQGPDR